MNTLHIDPQGLIQPVKESAAKPLKLSFLAPNILAIEEADGNFTAIAEMTSADELHRKLGRHIAALCNRHDPLVESLVKIFELIDEGILVRDTSRDHEPGWSLQALRLTRTLATAIKLMEAATT